MNWGLGCLGTVLYEFIPKLCDYNEMMHCVRVIVQNFGFWSPHYGNIVFICACIIFLMNGMIWHEF